MFGSLCWLCIDLLFAVVILPHAEPELTSDSHLPLLVSVSRPFQRTITMHKDSSGHVGFVYKSGKITSLVKDGSAARNGLLVEHHICEINGQNVIGLKVRRLLLFVHQVVWVN